MTTASNHIVITGAGPAGLSLAWLLDRVARRRLTISLVDPAPSTCESKMLSFWGRVPRHIAPSLAHTWTEMTMRFPAWQRREPLLRHHYHSVRATDLHDRLLDDLRESPRVRIVEDRAVGIWDHGEGRGATVSFAGSADTDADWVFQASPIGPRAHAERGLLQHFAGWEIETERPVFEPNAMTLMDFDVPQQLGATFNYVLPLAPNRALVEHTIFSADVASEATYAAGIEAYLERHVDSAWHVVRRERGVIPMRVGLDAQHPSPNVFRVGVAGGLTKPSTGYAFARTQQQVAHLVNALVRQGAPRALPSRSSRFRVYDVMLLRVLAQDASAGSAVFERLFRHNRFDDVLGFLGERTTVAEELQMLFRLPWRPFLNALPPALPVLRQALGRTPATTTP